MNESDIIVVDFPDEIYDSVVAQVMRYAIISLPFTIDRMKQIERYGIQQGNLNRIKNIFKGKLAEGLFEAFAKYNNMDIDFDVCSTPFYQVDKRDFLYGSTEFDIKNNFIYHSAPVYSRYVDLPAMIPNRFQGDQWSTKTVNHVGNQVAYLFSFMKGASLRNGKRSKEFVEVKISNNQANFLQDLYQQYNGQPQRNEPFNIEDFWLHIEKLGDLDFFKLSDRPKLVLCGIGNMENWNLFKDIGPLCVNNYQNNPIQKWYTKVGFKNSIKFLDGEIWGTITNRTCPIQFLKPVKEIFKELNKDKLQYAQNSR